MKRAARLLLLPLAAMLVAAGDPATPPEEESEHVVQAGETLGGIANRARVPRILIAEANGLKPPYVVRVGQTLKIPRTKHHVVKRGETGFTISYNYAVPWRDIAVANGMEEDAPIKTGQKLLIPTLIDHGDASATAVASPAAPDQFRWPLSGKVRRGYTARGERNYHDGMDIRAPKGTAVRATAEGKVLFAGKEPTMFGNMVVIDHGDGWSSAYAFLDRVTVKVGETAKQGERVGLVGSTGWARGNELHFEMRRENKPVDPRAHLPEGP